MAAIKVEPYTIEYKRFRFMVDNTPVCAIDLKPGSHRVCRFLMTHVPTRKHICGFFTKPQPLTQDTYVRPSKECPFWQDWEVDITKYFDLRKRKTKR